MSDIELDQYFQKIEPVKQGHWKSSALSQIDYPQDGNSDCYAIEDKSYWFLQRNRLISLIMKKLPPISPFFDIGGGNGFVSKKIQDMGINVILVEPGQSGIENAISRGLSTVIQADFSSTIVKNGQIPSAGLFDVLEHIEDDRKFLQEIHKTMLPSGQLFITVPAYQWLWSQEDVAALHHRRYRLKNLAKLVSNSGFEVQFQSYFFAYLILPIFFFRSLPYKLSKRATLRGPKSASEDHSPNSSFIQNALEFVFTLEYLFIKYIGKLPFGASIIIVAKKIEAT